MKKQTSTTETPLALTRDVSGTALLKSRICENCEHWDKQSTHPFQRKCTNEDYKNHYNMESCITGCFASCGWFKRSKDVKEKLEHCR